jgi:rfaE bifunctional protein kinase chain/domain
MTAAEFVSRVTGLKVLIVGDICLDQWCWYEPSSSQASAETGIPRIAVTRKQCTPGAAGTVAANLRSLGVEHVSVLGVVGDDGHGYELSRALNKLDIEADLVLRVQDLPTFTYTKLINVETDFEDQPRVDFIFSGELPASVDEMIASRLRDYGRHFDVICVSDQAETARGGVVTAKIRGVLKELASRGALIWVDSRKRIELFSHCVLKVNEEEARDALTRAGCDSLSELRKAAYAPLLFVTYGGRAVRICAENAELQVETRRVPNPVDICGAGDSFTAGASCALALGAKPEQAARLGHLVASVTIMKKGTGSASPAELLVAEERLGRQLA